MARPYPGFWFFPSMESLARAPQTFHGAQLMEGVLFDDRIVQLDPDTVHYAGSWHGPQIGARLSAWQAGLIAQFYERSLQFPAPVIWDIGANTGSFALLPCFHDGMTMIAFEPVPVLADLLVSNLKLNHLCFPYQSEMRYLVRRWALSNYTGKGTMRFPTDHAIAGMGLLNGEPRRFREWEDIPVRVETIDMLTQEGAIGIADMVKIDVEGAEKFVLLGGAQFFKTHRPVILCEVDERNTAQHGYAAEEIPALLEQWGYVVQREGDNLWATKP